MHLLTIQTEEAAVRRVPTAVAFIWTVLRVAFRVTLALLGFAVGVVHAIASAVCWVSLWLPISTRGPGPPPVLRRVSRVRRRSCLSSQRLTGHDVMYLRLAHPHSQRI